PAPGGPPAASALPARGLLQARPPARDVDVGVPLDAQPAALDGFPLGQHSDSHDGPTNKRGYLEAIDDAVNPLAPHLVAVTGDL
ncbi:metallophosphoesterase, partial [Burkholderia pseudomallei]